jgi:multimeric flavodoxin WrbA
MKIISLNFNQESRNNVFENILAAFLEGFKNKIENNTKAENNLKIEKNIEINSYNVSKLDIQSCQCCTKDINFIPNNICGIEDSMTEIYPKLEAADLWIFALPCYKNIVSTSFKKFLDRLEPLFYTPKNFGQNQNELNFKNNNSHGKLILFSTSESDLSSFQVVLEQMRNVADIFGREFLTPVLRPFYKDILLLEQMDRKPIEFYNSLRKAGNQIIENGDISPETAKTISKELIPADSFIKELQI